MSTLISRSPATSAKASDISSCAFQSHTRLPPFVWHCMRRMPSSLSSKRKLAYESLYSAYRDRFANRSPPLRPLQEAVDVRAQLGSIERRGLGGHREVDRREHRPLDVQVERALRRLDGLRRQRRDLLRGGDRGGEHLA